MITLRKIIRGGGKGGTRINLSWELEDGLGVWELEDGGYWLLEDA